MKTATFVGRHGGLLILVAVMVALMLPVNSHAGEFQRRRDDHPLVFLRYALYPVGSFLEYTIFRPAHQIAALWLPEDDCFAGASGCNTGRKQRQRYRASRR